MEFWEVVNGRRSVRSFLSDPVSRESLERIVGAGAMAPSSMNSQPWVFHVCEGGKRAEVGEAIAKATVHLDEYIEVMGDREYDDAVRWYSSLGGAPVVIAVSTPASEAEFERVQRTVSVGCAIENMLLAARAEGLGTCVVTMGWWVRSELQGVLSLPETEVVAAVIALGHPAAADTPVPSRRSGTTVWHG